MNFNLNDPSEQSAVQREAIAAGMQLLEAQGHARARFTMACGTGKTFTQLKLAEALLQAWGNGPRRIVVLVPTLALVRQSRDEWAAAQDQGDAYASLCVCSDPSLKTDVLQDQGEDHVELSEEELAELGVEPHANALSDVERINRWLDAREREFGSRAVSVIFTTYQSVQVVAMAMNARQPGDRAIHIGIFDEAHKTAGAAGKPFSYALSDANLAIGKRLFFTATERIAAPGKSARSGDLEEDGESQFISMDDEAVYGPRAYSLSFSQAAARGIIVPYEIIISVVGDPTIKGQKLSQRCVRSESGDSHRAIDIANMTALQRVMDKFNLNKAITFHRTVARAKDFAELRHTVEGARMDGSNGFNRLHVSGRQTSAQRRAQMQQYAQGGGRQVITNARCLTEGINVPATDIVGFMDSRGSTVDIVQAAGRTMRRAPGKTKGYIFLPVHDIEQDFGRVRDVLAAMAENDEVLMEEMRRVATAVAKQPPEDGGANRGEAILGRLPIQILTDGHGGEVKAEQLAQAIRVRLVQAARKVLGSFEVYLTSLQAFKAEHGNCHVIDNYIDAEGRNLGRWLFKQRQLHKVGELRESRRVRLEALGVIWKPLDFFWERNFDALRAFQFKHGHCNVPQSHVAENGLKLGVWLSLQRKSVKVPEYPQERRARLESLGVIWNSRDLLWERHFDALFAFRAKHGHCDVPQSHVTEEGLKLGVWVNSQRQYAKKTKYPQERRNRLEALGISWRVEDKSWALHFSALQDFREKFQHCDVPVSYVTDEGLKLGRWVFRQRQDSKKIDFPKERRLLLDGLGFSWRLRTIERVDEVKCFAALEIFKKENGHCNVPALYVTPDGLRLGQWLRGLKRKLTKESSVGESVRLSRLKEMGVVRSVQDVAWDNNFNALQVFRAVHGHCDVPDGYVTSGGLKLGSWLGTQRVKAKKSTYQQARRERLSLLGVTWNLNDAAWERCFAALVAFKGVHGHCNAPQSHVTADGLRLGSWINSQREAAKKPGYPQERRVRLEELGVQLPKPDK